jgi:hypothetical protein
MKIRKTLAFVQPFGFSSAGGGPRILRMLVEDAPMEVMSIVTSPYPAGPTSVLPELHLPARPNFGRLEWTRLNRSFNALNPLFAPRFRSRLKNLLVRKHVDALHIITHSADSMDAAQVAWELPLPFYLSIHDDLAYIIGRQSNPHATLDRLRTAWGEAAGRFVISTEMGEEYCNRYGSKSYSLVTDGLDTIAPAPKQRKPNSLRVYFMGLFHHSYVDNFKSLITAMAEIAVQQPGLDISLTLRCGSLPNSVVLPQSLHVNVLPFGTETEIAADMESADLLYMPLPLAEKYQGFTRFSLSTKMITYLGSGIPIFYHGPISNAAAGSLLQRKGAAICVDFLNPAQIRSRLLETVQEREAITQSALALAASHFRLEDTRKRFWDPIVVRTAQ